MSPYTEEPGSVASNPGSEDKTAFVFSIPDEQDAVNNPLKHQIELVLTYHRLGWKLIHLDRGAKKPERNGWQFERHTEDSLRETFGKELRNIGTLLGQLSNGLVDVDLDHPTLARFGGLLLPSTGMRFGRPSKHGGHRLFQCEAPPKYMAFDDPIPKKQGGVGRLAEIRTGSSQHTVLPGSVHPSGEPIEWECYDGLTTIDPDTLIKSVSRACAVALLAHHWPENSRHFASLALAGGLSNAGWSEQEILDFIEHVCTLAGDKEVSDRLTSVKSTVNNKDEGVNVTGWPTLTGFIDERVVKKVRQWLGIETRADRHPTTDFGNAERFVEQHNGSVLYLAKVKTWLVWDGQRWLVDERGLIQEKAKETIRSLLLEAAKATTEDEQTRLSKWALACQQGKHLELMLTRAQSDQRIVVGVDDLDADLWLVNLANGTLDLRRGELRPHNPEDLITKLLQVAWDPNAKCPKWLSFIQSAMSKPTKDGLVRQPEMESYVQRLIGYCLCGDVREKMLPIAWGEKNTGKTTLTEILRALLGDDYSGVLSESSIAAGANASGTNHDMADYRGTRLLVVSETAENLNLNESRIKAWTGGNPVRARHLFKEYFTYSPQYKVFIETNEKPNVNGRDKALWFRLKLIPFLNEISETQIDRTLKDQLLEELPGILAWAVAGFMEWQRLGGLDEPEQVKTATAAYQKSSDPLAEFFEEKCVLDEAGRVRSGLLYDTYLQWSPRGEVGVSREVFAKYIEDSYGLSATTIKGYKTWKGIRLRTAADDPEDSEASGEVGKNLFGVSKGSGGG